MKSIEQLKIELMLKVLAGTLHYWDDINGLPIDDDLRTFVCSLGPMYAYFYARYVDKEPRKATREASCKDPLYADCYDRYVGRCSREDTRVYR